MSALAGIDIALWDLKGKRNFSMNGLKFVCLDAQEFFW